MGTSCSYCLEDCPCVLVLGLACGYELTVIYHHHHHHHQRNWERSGVLVCWIGIKHLGGGAFFLIFVYQVCLKAVLGNPLLVLLIIITINREIDH